MKYVLWFVNYIYKESLSSQIYAVLKMRSDKQNAWA